jgi:DNA gyrase subunit A
MIGRPNLENVSSEIIAYIEHLESELEQAQAGKPTRPTAQFDVSEAPTNQTVITLTSKGIAKRTYRHLYQRQRRGGMGVFDIDTPESDPPKLMVQAEENQHLIVLTTLARAFRLPVSSIPLSTDLHEKGHDIFSEPPFEAGEQWSTVIVEGASLYMTVVSEKGWVRSFPRHIFGENAKPGTVLYHVREHGKPTGACYHSSDDHLLIATQNGLGIRFSARHIPNFGCQGIRLASTDATVSICPANLKESVFLLADDGKGTIREMAGFAENKAAGAGGKQLLKAEKLVSALRVTEKDDLFVLSKLSKIVRFSADEVPPKEGVVQGVNCMALRADTCVAVLACTVKE